MINILCFVITRAVVLVLVIRSLDAVTSFQLTILHTNDVHARFEQYTIRDGRCQDYDATHGKCFGGLARRATLVKKFRKQGANVLLLDAGDQYQGTPWFYYYKGKAASHFMNKLQYDAMSLGNHEFDNDIDGLVPFLSNITFPVVCANVNLDLEPKLNELIIRSTVLLVGGKNIGIVGYLTKETTTLSHTGRLTFEDEVSAVQREVDILTAEGVDIIIALGHAGFQIDKDIAQRVTGIDIVIGGHTNTFLYTGRQPSTDKPEGPYPLVVTQDTGEKIYVLEAYAFGKYLGYFRPTFDNNGKVVKYDGNPILLDNSVQQDADILQELSVWGAEVQALYASVVGFTSVYLDGTFGKCRLEECVLGNLIADAMVSHYNSGGKWPNLRMAVLNGGGIRSSIEEGNITYGDVLQVLPFGNGIDIVEIFGKDLIQVLEYSIANYSNEIRSGKFLQVSGFKVTYDLRKENGARVEKVEIVCQNCTARQFDPIDEDAVYQLAVPSYLANGGDGYSIIPKVYKQHYNLGDIDADIFVKYLGKQSPVQPEIENRIVLMTDETSSSLTVRTTHFNKTITALSFFLLIYNLLF